MVAKPAASCYTFLTKQQKEEATIADLTIGQRIAQERKKLNISQVGLATRLDVSRQAISKWESDAAIPEIDKLIALSRLFGVSVGWLLGVEDPAVSQAEALTEDHYKIIEELVKKYQTPPKPHLTVFHYLFALGASLLIFLFLYGTTSRLEKQILMYESNTTALSSSIAALSKRLDALEAAPQALNTPGQLLAGYSLEPYPLAATKSGRRVKVSFSAVPHIWNIGDIGYICVSGPEEPFRIKCDWDSGHLTAELILEIEDGYDLCFAVEHSDNSQEQQLLEHEIIENLAEAFTIPIQVERGSAAYENGAVVLTGYTTRFDMPVIYELVKEGHAIAQCEYRLYRRPNNDSKVELLRADVLPSYTNDPIPGYPFRVSPPEIRFEEVDIQNCNHMQLRFYIKLDNGVEREYPITVFLPDGQGGLTE